MKICVWNWNSVLNDVIEELTKEHTLVQKWEDADVVVIWNEVKRGGWADIVKNAQKAGKKVVLYQQGVWGIDRVQPPFNEKLQSKNICVWGERDKERLIKYGTNPENIYVTGCPLLRYLKPKEKHDGKNVVFALEHWDTEELLENMLVYGELRKLKGPNVIIKAIKGEHDLNIYDNVIATKRYDKNHMFVVADLLATTDLVVAISESTFAFLAECMDIPVVIADVWTPKIRAGESKYLDYRHPFTDAVTKVNLEDLNKTILWQLKNPNLLKEKRSQSARENGGNNIKDPAKELINIITKL